MSVEWDPRDYEDHYRERLPEVIESKRKGRTIKAPTAVDEPAPVPDLMAALRESLDAARGRAPAAAGEREPRLRAGGPHPRRALRARAEGGRAGPLVDEQGRAHRRAALSRFGAVARHASVTSSRHFLLVDAREDYLHPAVAADVRRDQRRTSRDPKPMSAACSSSVAFTVAVVPSSAMPAKHLVLHPERRASPRLALLGLGQLGHQPAHPAASMPMGQRSCAGAPSRSTTPARRTSARCSSATSR